MLGFCIAMLGLYTASESDLYPDNDGTVSHTSTKRWDSTSDIYPDNDGTEGQTSTQTMTGQ